MAIESILQGLQGWDVPVFSLGTGLLSVLLVGALVSKLVVFIKYYKFYHNLPGSSDRSYLWGHTPKLDTCGEMRLAYGRKRMKECNGRYTCFWFGPFRPVVAVYHPELVKKVLRTSSPKPKYAGSPYSLITPWIGEGLIVANGERWARSRRLLTPAFHFDVLKNYLQIYNKAADRLFAKLDKLAETGESFDVCPLMTLYSLEVILKCSLGFEGDIQGKGHPYAQAAKELTEILDIRTRKPWMWPNFIFRLTAEGKQFHKHCDFVHKFAEEIITKRKEERDNGKINTDRHLDFIDILLSATDEEGKHMTIEEIRNEVDTFMFAGHDSTANSIPWVLYTLARNPDYQDRIKEETDSLLEGRDNPYICWQDLSKFETLTLCIKESLRLHSTVPFIIRHLDVDVDFDGQKIPAGTTVSIAIVHLHHNPHVWDQPSEFRPERFRAENKRSLDSFAFIPFAAGPRNCIGQNFAMNEEKVLLARLFQRYHVRPAPDVKPPQQLPTIVLKTETGNWLTLQKR